MARLQLSTLIDDGLFEDEQAVEEFVAGVIAGKLLKDGAEFDGLDEDILASLRENDDEALRGLDELIDQYADEDHEDHGGNIFDPIDEFRA